MPANRYFIPSPFHQGQIIKIGAHEFHHLTRVMRQKKGDLIEIVSGMNQRAKGCIVAIESDEAQIRVDSLETKPPPPKITLAFPYCRQSKLDFVIEKGGELGATSFRLYPAEKGEKTVISPPQMQRIESLLISSMKQCGRLDLPSVQ